MIITIIQQFLRKRAKHDKLIKILNEYVFMKTQSIVSLKFAYVPNQIKNLPAIVLLFARLIARA